MKPTWHFLSDWRWSIATTSLFEDRFLCSIREISLEAAAPVRTLSRTELNSFEFRNRTHTTYRGSQVTYQNPTTKSLIFQSVTATAPIPTGDLLKVVSRCENGQQALLRAQAALNAQNMLVYRCQSCNAGLHCDGVRQ